MLFKLHDKVSKLLHILLGFPLILLQLIIFLVHPGIPSFFLLIISCFINLLTLMFAQISHEVAFLNAVSNDFINRFKGCQYDKIPLTELLGSQITVDTLDQNSLDSELRNNLGLTDKSFNKIKQSIENIISVYQVTPSKNKEDNNFAGGASYNSGFNSFVFLPEYKLPVRRFPKFLVYHEIGHNLSLSIIPISEIKVLRIFYCLILPLILFELDWTIQALLLFITFTFTSLDFFGNNLRLRIHRAKLQSEVFADQYATAMLSDVEKLGIANSLKSGKVVLYDHSLSPDENNIRIGRLINTLENKPQDDSFLVPISHWDNHCRFFFLLLLGTNTYLPNYWHVLGGGIILVLLFFISMFAVYEPQRLSKEIYNQLTNQPNKQAKSINTLPIPNTSSPTNQTTS